MSTVLAMIQANIPLHTWRTFVDTRPQRSETSFGYLNGKNLDKMANAIVSALSNDDVVELIAKEWGQFSSMLRTRVTQIANERRGTASNSVSKNIDRLDKRLEGKILTQEDPVLRERKLRVIDGRLVRDTRIIRPEVASAQRAHATSALPADYNKWSPGRKRLYNQQRAAERRGK